MYGMDNHRNLIAKLEAGTFLILKNEKQYKYHKNDSKCVDPSYAPFLYKL